MNQIFYRKLVFVLLFIGGGPIDNGRGFHPWLSACINGVREGFGLRLVNVEDVSNERTFAHG